MKPLVYKRTRKAARTKPVPQAMKMHVTKGDTVQVISGDDKGKRGTVLRTSLDETREKELRDALDAHLKANPPAA